MFELHFVKWLIWGVWQQRPSVNSSFKCSLCWLKIERSLIICDITISLEANSGPMLSIHMWDVETNLKPPACILENRRENWLFQNSDINVLHRLNFNTLSDPLTFKLSDNLHNRRFRIQRKEGMLLWKMLWERNYQVKWFKYIIKLVLWGSLRMSI